MYEEYIRIHHDEYNQLIHENNVQAQRIAELEAENAALSGALDSLVEANYNLAHNIPICEVTGKAKRHCGHCKLELHTDAETSQSKRDSA